MKKVYMAPAMEEHKIATNQILCVSGQLDPEQTITDPDQVGSRELIEFDGF
ncbi:MAG: hypothetical protein IJ614_04815 [Prevotella sp.]|nr:hypothetical protein [Prevotella sp.]